MPFRIVSFDVDGTLVDHDFSQRMWREELPRLYARTHGTSFEEATNEVFKAFSGVGEDDPEWFSFEYWFERFELGDHHDFVEEHRGKVPLYPEVEGALKRLGGNGRSLVVNSNAPRDILEIELESIAHHFDHIFSAPTDFNRVKVNSEYYEHICFFLGIEPEEMIHVGDRWIDDVISPEKAGVHAVYLDRNADARGNGAVRDLSEFTSLLENGRS